MAGNVKSNKERCRELTKKVESLEKVVSQIQLRGQGSVSDFMKNTLKDLRSNLQSTSEWMEKYTQKKHLNKFMGGGNYEEKFRKLNQKLSENCQLLTLALQVEHGEKIDMIYDTLAQRGSAAVRQRAAIPTFSLPEQTPAPLALVPQPGPASFPLDTNYSAFGQTFDPIMPLSVPLPDIDFSNSFFNPPWLSQLLNSPDITSFNATSQFSSVIYSDNGTVTYVANKTYYNYQ